MTKKTIAIMGIFAALFSIFCFQQWITWHDIKLIQSSIYKNHLSDKNNINEKHYMINLEYVEKYKLKVPWGINQIELKTLLVDKEISEEDEYFISFLGSQNSVITFNFNNANQLYNAKETKKINRFKEEEIYSFYQYMEHYVIDKGYLADYESKNKSKNSEVELIWIDEFGRQNKKMIDNPNQLSFHEINKIVDFNSDYIDCKDEKALLNKLLFENNTIIRRLWYYNSTTLEYTIKKYDDYTIVSEFLLENKNLAN